MAVPSPDHPACPYPSFPPPVPVRLVMLPDHNCPYLPDRQATSRAFYAQSLPATLYHQLMDAGFRRSGRVVYQPICRGCRACLMIRVPIARFESSKSQRRCWRRNQNLLVTSDVPVPTDEKFELYQRYQTQWHGKQEAENREAFESFLYDSPVDSIEFTYRNTAGNLLAVGICDVAAESLSSVYFYYDPKFALLGLGTFGALFEIEYARKLAIPYYYLGYWVQDCNTMEYKANYRPCEVLHPDQVWRENQISDRT